MSWNSFEDCLLPGRWDSLIARESFRASLSANRSEKRKVQNRPTLAGTTLASTTLASTTLASATLASTTLASTSSNRFQQSRQFNIVFVSPNCYLVKKHLYITFSSVSTME